MKPSTLFVAVVFCCALGLNLPGDLSATEAPPPPATVATSLPTSALPAAAADRCEAASSLFGTPPAQERAACTGCDSPQGSCTQPPAGSSGVCDFYCQELVGETGFCSLACGCCMCPYVQVTCGWICVCFGLPTGYPTNDCPTNCSVQWYCW